VQNPDHALPMNASLPRIIAPTAFVLLAIIFVAPRARAVEALLLQDTYVDNGPTGDDPPPNASNYGAGTDLHVFKGNGRLGRTFLKFSLETLPPDTAASHVTHARLRLWVNSRSTAAGSITLTPVTTHWDEYTLKHNTTGDLTFGRPQLSELQVESMNNFISIDVTTLVKAWLNGTLVNEGIEIAPSANTKFLDLAFDSKESDRTSHEARLEISLDNSANTPSRSNE
jgi:hypothetical protein